MANFQLHIVNENTAYNEEELNRIISLYDKFWEKSVLRSLRKIDKTLELKSAIQGNNNVTAPNNFRQSQSFIINRASYRILDSRADIQVLFSVKNQAL